MSHNPADADDGGFQQPPSEQAYLSASDADRRAAIEIINRGHAEGRLTEPERQDRVTRAQVARTRPELNVLTSDLVVIQDAHHADEMELRASGSLTPTSYGSNDIVAVLSTKQRDGHWVVPRSTVGKIFYTFVPTNDAAPDAPTVYSIGGTLHYNDGVNFLRVTTTFADNARDSLAEMQAALPRPFLERAATAFLDAYAQAWGP